MSTWTILRAPSTMTGIGTDSEPCPARSSRMGPATGVACCSSTAESNSTLRRIIGAGWDCLFDVAEVWFDRAADLDGQGISGAVAGSSGRQADPAFAYAIFLDVG